MTIATEQNVRLSLEDCRRNREFGGEGNEPQKRGENPAGTVISKEVKHNWPWLEKSSIRSHSRVDRSPGTKTRAKKLTLHVWQTNWEAKEREDKKKDLCVRFRIETWDLKYNFMVKPTVMHHHSFDIKGEEADSSIVTRSRPWPIWISPWACHPNSCEFSSHSVTVHRPAITYLE